MLVWLATPTIRPRYLTGGHKSTGNSQFNIEKSLKYEDFSNIQGSVTKSGNVTFFFRLEGFLLNDTDWINDFKEKRTQYGVSQNQLAVMAGVSREYVSRLESGKVALTEEIKVKFTDALERLNPDNPLEMVLDYVRIRFPTQDVKHVVEDILKIRFDVMIHEDFGFYSYAEHYVLGDVFVLASPDKEKGTLLELKGKGCRQMETAGQDAWSVKSEERLRLVLLAVSLVLRLLLRLRKRRIIQNQQAAVIPDQTIRHLPIVEVMESRLLYPISRTVILHRQYIAALQARRRKRVQLLSVVSWIKKRYRNSSHQENRINKDRYLIRNLWNRIRSDRPLDQ